jgi:hypothetical protein
LRLCVELGGAGLAGGACDIESDQNEYKNYKCKHFYAPWRGHGGRGFEGDPRGLGEL